jgi:hypothetical protein
MNPLYVMNQANNIMRQVGNPQALIQRFLPNVPAEIRNDPNRIISWLQETGKITPEQIRQAQQMMGRR